MSNQELRCSTFYCDRRGGRFCCVSCPDPCKNRCLNHPDRCKLAKLRNVKNPPKPRHDLEPVERAEVMRLLREGVMSETKIAERFDISVHTVKRYLARVKLEQKQEGEARKWR